MKCAALPARRRRHDETIRMAAAQALCAWKCSQLQASGLACNIIRHICVCILFLRLSLCNALDVVLNLCSTYGGTLRLAPNAHGYVIHSSISAGRNTHDSISMKSKTSSRAALLTFGSSDSDGNLRSLLSQGPGLVEDVLQLHGGSIRCRRLQLRAGHSDTQFAPR